MADACSQCPHTNDCLKMGSCLDEVNARYLAEHRNQFPRLMTSAQASISMARLRAGETVRRMTSGSKKIGKALVPYNKYKNHCSASRYRCAEPITATTIASETKSSGGNDGLLIL